MKMKEYNVTITETLTLTVPVEASSKEDALEIVCDGWHEGDYIVEVVVEVDGGWAVMSASDYRIWAIQN